MKKSWQNQPLIDHLLFRELFREVLRDTHTAGSTLRPSEYYVITSTGVRWREDEDVFVQEAGRMLGADAPEIAIYVRENIRPAQLELPCSPAQALEWVQRDDGRCAYAPDWLIEALMQPDVDHALAIVEGAQPEPAEEAEDEREQREERRSIRLAAEALRRIRNMMPSPAAKPRQQRVRSLGYVVGLALDEMGAAAGAANARQVISHLRSWDAAIARARGLSFCNDGRTLYLTEEGPDRPLDEKRVRGVLNYRSKKESDGAE